MHCTIYSTLTISYKINTWPRFKVQCSMITFLQNEMTPLPKPMQILECNPLNRRTLRTQLLHGQHTILFILLGLISLLGTFRQIILTPQINHTGCNGGFACVLEDVACIFGDLGGNIGQSRFLIGNIVGEVGWWSPNHWRREYASCAGSHLVGVPGRGWGLPITHSYLPNPIPTRPPSGGSYVHSPLPYPHLIHFNNTSN